MNINDIIEIDNQEFIVIDEIELDDNKYYLISEVNEEEVSDEVEVVKIDNGLIYSVDDVKEQEKVTKYILENLKDEWWIRHFYGNS